MISIIWLAIFSEHELWLFDAFDCFESFCVKYSVLNSCILKRNNGTTMTLDAQYSCYEPSAMEDDAISNLLRQSQHTSLALMPNHHIDGTGQLCGFTFLAHAEDLAKVLPITSKMFEATCIYEVVQDVQYEVGEFGLQRQEDPRFNETVLDILNDMGPYQAKLTQLLHELQVDSSNQANLSCMPELLSADDSLLQHYTDCKSWNESQPEFVGLHHAFVHSHVSCRREHKLFIVLSGYLTHACNDLYNLWHDCKEHLSCASFAQSSEVHWLRTATIRSLNRVAYQIAQSMKLQVNTLTDFEDPAASVMARPTTISFKHDIRVLANTNQVQIVNCGCFTDLTRNGVVFDTKGTDGLWLFTGPTDFAEGSSYGTELRATRYNCFPTETVIFNDNFKPESRIKYARKVDDNCLVFQPDEEFMQSTELLGFNRNNQIVYLMELMGCTVR